MSKFKYVIMCLTFIFGMFFPLITNAVTNHYTITVQVSSTYPYLESAPTFSSAPTVTQSSSPTTTWTGNTITVSNGTWNNCGSCTYTYQYWLGNGFHNQIITQGVQTASYTIPSSTGNATNPNANTLVWATVTASNGSGSAMSAITPTVIKPVPTFNNPVLVTPPSIAKCTDSTCTSTVPITNTLGVGDWITLTAPGTYTNVNGSQTYSYVWEIQSEATGGSPESIPAATATKFQITSSIIAYNGATSPVNAVLSIQEQVHTSVGTYTFNSAWVGPVQLSPSTVIPPPTAKSLPNLTITPSTAGGAYVGAMLQYQGLDSAIWRNYPSPFTTTYQWYYCNSACTTPSSPGTLLNGTPINSFIGTSYQGATLHTIDSADIGHQIFMRTWATSNGGTSIADSAPTPVITNPPSAPAQGTIIPLGGSILPSISGLAVYGSVGAGTDGALIVGDYGSWNYALTMTTQWYSCPPATPNCTTPATGPTGLTPPNYGRQGSTYKIVSADLGNVLWMKATGGNALGSTTYSSAPTAVVTSYTAPPPLPATALRTYPSGQDMGPNAPTCASEPADAPDSGGTTWYVDIINGSTPNSTFGGTGTADGTAAHPFNSLRGLFLSGITGYPHPLISTAGTGSNWTPATPKTNYINPGDRIIVEGGNGTTVADYGSLGTFGGFKNTAGTGGTGATKFIKISADPNSATRPIIDGLNLTSNIGLQFKGFWIKPGGSNTMVGVGSFSGQGSSHDIIVSDGVVSPWASMTDAINAYTAACISPGVCAQANFPQWATAQSKAGVGISGDYCIAYDNNLSMFTNGDVRLNSIYPRSILIEGNEFKWTIANDIVDYNNGATIFHNNYTHDPMGGVGSGVHVDNFQSQAWSNATYWSLYGVIKDGNVLYSHTTTDGAILAAFPDPKQCVTNGNPSNCTSNNYTASLSGEEGTGNYFTGNKVVNHVMINNGHLSPSRSVLGTYVNNTFLSDGNGPGVFELLGLSNSDYVANNVANNWACPAGLTTTWPSNIGVAWGPSPPTMPASVAGCPTGVTDSAVTTSPFTSWSPWNNGNAVNPATVDLHPTTGSALKNTGTGGNGAPTVDISGTTRSVSTPSIGAYE